MSIECRKARPDHFPALRQMLEPYEYEPSDIWPLKVIAEVTAGRFTEVPVSLLTPRSASTSLWTILAGVAV